ncbi:MAG TPA: type II toxin-antitoxin system RelE/ParE family toxin [Thermoanaerobaculia bacterium]|nr:type II toxin-antitoxin system RelE/ParE family toxin [Thermoanaerobaculia bacterium]
MKYQLRIRSDARNDIRSARDWYARQGPGLDARFGEELGTTLTSIEEQPLLYAVIYRDVRRAMTRRFPYAIYFVVDNDRISVLRVLHHARDPREWQSRA